MDEFEGFTQNHIDVLKELANIGSGSAITALSKMINCEIKMQVPVVNFVNFRDIASFVGGEENIIVGILVNLSGDIEGMMMFIIELESSRALLRYLLGNNQSEDSFSELQLSALEEVGNIVSSSYLGSLSVMINKKITPSVPYLSIDMANAILSVPAIEFSKIADKVLFIESVFNTENGDDISGYFLLVPDLTSFNLMMSSFGL